MTTRIAPGVGANLLGQHSAERYQDATVYVGNLETKVSEELLWELFVQAGPVFNVYVPGDPVTNAHQGYGFVEFRSEEDADYAIKVLNMIKLYGKAIRVNKASQDKKSVDLGANLFIGNLNPIMRDPETGNSCGFGFISYESFDASYAAIETMNGQYLRNRQITVSYAYKKDTKGERHGTPAERVLAASNPTTQKNRPHTMFASGPPILPPQPNGTVSAPVPPRPFANGTVPPAPIPALRPPPPQTVHPPMQMSVPSWQGQPSQPGPTGIPPPPMQQFRSMPPPPPPPQVPPALARPPPPPAGLVAPPVWRPPPPPHQLTSGPHTMPHMSMPPHQPLNTPPPPPPQC